MDGTKLEKAQKARELARWFRTRLHDGIGSELKGLMASTAVALEWEAFELERQGGARRHPRKPRLVSARAA
ncbi:MAG: hypothetical protein ABSD74_19545 [Rhizomicrobium sp.]|jgi:hypothetical protein